MQVNAPALPVVPAQSAAPSSGTATPPGDDHAFARLLSARQAQQGSAHAPNKASDAGTHDKTTARDAASPRAAKELPTDAPGTDAAEADGAKKTAAPDDDPQVTMDPALADWLAALHRPVDAARAATDTSKIESLAGADAAASAAASAPRDAAKPAADAEPRHAHGAERNAKPVELAEQATATAHHDTDIVAAVKHQDDAARPLDHSGPVDAPASANALAVLAAAPRGEHAASAPLKVDVPTPVNAPEFRGALGVQVSVLARDGVQHAQLNLNPAEMGPISVQIALDGTQAQVDFGADSATTRQIIESGLPELAAALRDAGLTLSGGGVSQHSRGQRQGDGSEPGRQGSVRAVGDAAESDAVAVRRTGWRVPQGAVDLYA